MKHNKRRIFWFCMGVAATIGFMQLLEGQGAVKAGKQVEITEDAPTVWDIAKQEFPGKDPRQIVYEIKRLNPGLEYGQVQPGQTIMLPAGE